MSALKGNLPESSGSKGGGVEASWTGERKRDIQDSEWEGGWGRKTGN